jgi:hypothetical protein
MMSARLHAAMALAVVLVVAGCGGGGTPKRKDTDLQVKTQADAEQLAKALADSVAAAVDSPLEKWHTQPAPCDDAAGVTAVDGPWNLSGFATVAVKPAEQVTTLNRLRDQWKQQGYEITEFHLVPPDNEQGTLSARSPASDLTISLASTAQGTGLAVIIATPCYRPAPGENPGN